MQFKGVNPSSLFFIQHTATITAGAEETSRSSYSTYVQNKQTQQEYSNKLVLYHKTQQRSSHVLSFLSTSMHARYVVLRSYILRTKYEVSHKYRKEQSIVTQKKIWYFERSIILVQVLRARARTAHKYFVSFRTYYTEYRGSVLDHTRVGKILMLYTGIQTTISTEQFELRTAACQ